MKYNLQSTRGSNIYLPRGLWLWGRWENNSKRSIGKLKDILIQRDRNFESIMQRYTADESWLRINIEE